MKNGLRTLAKDVRRLRDQAGVAELAAECTKEIDEAHASVNKNQEEYDKQLLTLSTAALAFLIAFIKDIVPFPGAAYKMLFYAALGVFTLCVLAVLASYQISKFGLVASMRWWQKRREVIIEDNKTTYDVAFPYWIATLIRVWNIVTGLLFAVGVALCVIFVVINLVRDKAVPINHAPFEQVPRAYIPHTSQPASR